MFFILLCFERLAPRTKTVQTHTNKDQAMVRFSEPKAACPSSKTKSQVILHDAKYTSQLLPEEMSQFHFATLHASPSVTAGQSNAVPHSPLNIRNTNQYKMSKEFANQISGRQPRKEALLLLLHSKEVQGLLGWAHHKCNKCKLVWACSMSSDPNKLIGCMT